MLQRAHVNETVSSLVKVRRKELNCVEEVHCPPAVSFKLLRPYLSIIMSEKRAAVGDDHYFMVVCHSLPYIIKNIM